MPRAKPASPSALAKAWAHGRAKSRPPLPARFKRIRGGNPLVSYELLVGKDGRINAKHESVAGVGTYHTYEYDAAGHLLRAWRGGRLAEEYAYDPRGARVAAWSEQQGEWKYACDQRGRLIAAGPWQFSYAADGTLREAWTPASRPARRAKSSRANRPLP